MKYSLVRSAVIQWLSVVLFGVSALSAQAPVNQPHDTKGADYYLSAYRLSGIALKTALHNLIDGHTVVSYDGLYNAFPTTDTKPNNIVWDIYSDRPGGTPAYTYTHGVKKCGSYSGEGDCYNREHSWPDSWLGETNPARSDLFHMYPTDGYVNNRRSNYPFGVVNSASWTSTNGSKVGSNAFPGYSGTVFEPINEYKGDLARSMMYMSVRYFTEDAGFSTSPATNKSELLTWYANLMYSWHLLDTVSTKESNRNNAIFTFQNNRNPFIDHPEFAAEIWMTGMAPSVHTVKILSASSVMIDFTRYLDSAQALNPANYTWDSRLGTPISYEFGIDNDISKVKVNFASVTSGLTYSLSVRNQKSINSIAMRDTSVYFTATGTTSVQAFSEIPASFSLSQNYPNPFNPTTVIKYNIFTSGNVDLAVYDMLGNKVCTLLSGYKASGEYSETFNAENLSAGLYFIHLKTGSFSRSIKALLLK